MSETERRRKYRYDRVLIETARILSPQFAPSTLYFSGAQIELMRNLTQYLHRMSSFVSVYEDGAYLVPTDVEWDSIQAIVADLEETLMGNPNVIWGYADRWFEPKWEQSTGAAYTDVLSTPVPAGYVYILEHYNLRHEADSTCAVEFVLVQDPGPPILYTVPNLPIAEWVCQSVNLTLKEGDRVRLRVWGLENNNWCQFILWGHRMELPE